MITKHDYANKCWWCGSDANSREHKYKKSDLINEFGRGAYSGTKSVVRVTSGQERPVQGPNSNEVKFQGHFCQRCNNETSQPFDTAYRAFTSHIKSNEKSITQSKQFKFSDIYGSTWQTDKDNLMRYYVKHIGCRLADSKVLIVPEVIDFLNGNSALRFISLNFEIRDDIVATINKLESDGDDSGMLWIGDMDCMSSPSTGEITNINSHITYRWLRLNYGYDLSIPANSNNFSSDLVILQSDFNVDPSTIN